MKWQREWKEACISHLDVSEGRIFRFSWCWVEPDVSPWWCCSFCPTSGFVERIYLEDEEVEHQLRWWYLPPFWVTVQLQIIILLLTFRVASREQLYYTCTTCVVHCLRYRNTTSQSINTLPCQFLMVKYLRLHLLPNCVRCRTTQSLEETRKTMKIRCLAEFHCRASPSIRQQLTNA
jgi:hypothetical protein